MMVETLSDVIDVMLEEGDHGTTWKALHAAVTARGDDALEALLQQATAYLTRAHSQRPDLFQREFRAMSVRLQIDLMCAPVFKPMLGAAKEACSLPVVVGACECLTYNGRVADAVDVLHIREVAGPLDIINVSAVLNLMWERLPADAGQTRDNLVRHAAWFVTCGSYVYGPDVLGHDCLLPSLLQAVVGCRYLALGDSPAAALGCLGKSAPAAVFGTYVARLAADGVCLDVTNVGNGPLPHKSWREFYVPCDQVKLMDNKIMDFADAGIVVLEPHRKPDGRWSLVVTWAPDMRASFDIDVDFLSASHATRQSYKVVDGRWAGRWDTGEITWYTSQRHLRIRVTLLK